MHLQHSACLRDAQNDFVSVGGIEREPAASEPTVQAGADFGREPAPEKAARETERCGSSEVEWDCASTGWRGGGGGGMRKTGDAVAFRARRMQRPG